MRFVWKVIHSFVYNDLCGADCVKGYKKVNAL